VALLENSSLQVHRIDTGRITLNVRELGSGPLALFLHGITSNAAVFDPVVIRLSRQLRCIAVDQRGHGLSDKPESGYSARDFSEDVIALIETLNVGPAVIIGHSLGARNAVETAVLAPKLVRAVVAIDFTPFIETEVLDALDARISAGERVFGSYEEIEAYLRERYPLMPSEAIRRRAQSGYGRSNGVLRPYASAKALMQTASGLREDLEPAFRRISCPVLVVRGSVSKVVSKTAFDKTRLLRSDLSTLVVENADHFVNEESPEFLSEEIMHFLVEFTSFP
jgi:2-(acetamidomethylene)succinate hydrolase